MCLHLAMTLWRNEDLLSPQARRWRRRPHSQGSWPDPGGRPPLSDCCGLPRLMTTERVRATGKYMKVHSGLYAHKSISGSLEFFWGLGGHLQYIWSILHLMPGMQTFDIRICLYCIRYSDWYRSFLLRCTYMKILSSHPPPPLPPPPPTLACTLPAVATAWGDKSDDPGPCCWRRQCEWPSVKISTNPAPVLWISTNRAAGLKVLFVRNTSSSPWCNASRAFIIRHHQSDKTSPVSHPILLFSCTSIDQVCVLCLLKAGEAAWELFGSLSRPSVVEITDWSTKVNHNQGKSKAGGKQYYISASSNGLQHKGELILTLCCINHSYSSMHSWDLISKREKKLF